MMGVADAGLEGEIGVAEELPVMVLIAVLALLVPRLLGGTIIVASRGAR
jgi:hypothetical protein